MLTKIKANFDFSKALNGLEQTIDETMAEVGSENVKSIKQTIDKKGYGQYPGLSGTRMVNRERGIGFPDPPRGKLVGRTSKDTPLKQTGNLYNSIQVKKDGIYMASYGITHNYGLIDKKYPDVGNMVKRDFIDIGMSRADLSKVEDNFTEKIKKLIKK